MGEILKNVGPHSVYSKGHYEATVSSDGTVIIYTEFGDPKTERKVTLPSAYWDRLVAWVEYQRKNNALESEG